MKGRTAVWALGAILALAGTASAEGPAAKEEEKKTKTVKKEDVKTGVMTVDGKEWSIRPATPAYEGDTGLFHLSTAYTLPKGKFAFSAFRDNYVRDPKDLDISIHGLSFAYGATSSFEIFGQIGFQNRIDADALFQAGFQNDYPLVSKPWETGFGDVKLGVKYKFLDDYRGQGVGLAIKALVKLPTADEAKGLGTGKASFGADLVLSKNIAYKLDLHGSVGYRANGDPDQVDIGNAFRWGVGFNVPACSLFQFQADLTGSVYSDTSPQQTNPVDLVVGPVFHFKNGIFLRPAVSWNLNFVDRGLGSGVASYTGLHGSVGYHPGTPCCEVYVPPPPAPPPVNRPPTVALDCLREQLLAGETTPCKATASDPDGDPLTYTWSTSAGRVAGSGPNATLDTAGVPCGTTITVTVTVSDGRGGTASATDTVKVICPEKAKPEPITCTSGGFPRNLARLNNVDKACLDDVASRLRQDPRSRVVIVGHADQSERYAEVIGRKRAEAVKAYLVKERGVEESRVTARSAAASRPLDTGTSPAARAKNRRVEVIFVPEGATVPEGD